MLFYWTEKVVLELDFGPCAPDQACLLKSFLESLCSVSGWAPDSDREKENKPGSGGASL